jgi:hypothetical protein
VRDSPDLRPLWLAYILLAATLVGITAGLLSWLGGMEPPTAILAGGGAFSAAALLMLSLQRFLAPQTPERRRHSTPARKK